MGKNIHTLVMLLNKILHKTKETKKDFMLLKLDTTKAFDYMGLEFLSLLLQRIGVGLAFIKMVKANYSTKAMSTILFQGKLHNPFNLLRLAKQRCPLSSLLFLIVVNTLSCLLPNTAHEGIIKGVRIEELGKEYTHGKFVDNINILVEAKPKYIANTFQIFHQMGLAPGLFVKETRVKAIFISPKPLPKSLQGLD